MSSSEESVSEQEYTPKKFGKEYNLKKQKEYYKKNREAKIREYFSKFQSTEDIINELVNNMNIRVGIS